MAKYTKAITVDEAYEIGWHNLQPGQWILNTGGGLGRFVRARLSRHHRWLEPRDAYDSVWVVWASCYPGEGFGSHATARFRGLREALNSRP